MLKSHSDYAEIARPLYIIDLLFVLVVRFFNRRASYVTDGELQWHKLVSGLVGVANANGEL